MPTEQPSSEVDQRAASDTGDGGWTVESASAPVEASPVDTTVTPPARESRSSGERKASRTRTAGETTEVSAGDGEFEEDGDATGESAEVEKPVRGRTADKKDPFKRIQALTKNWRNTERQLETERTQRADLERRLHELSTKPAGQAERQAPERQQPVAPAEPVMPEPPRYAEFDTDEAYTAAVAKYRTDVVGWQTARETRLAESITRDVEGRLTRDREQHAASQQEAAVIGRLRSIHDRHPDFSERVAEVADTLKDVQSPFLNDMITNHADGGELLYELASDEDLILALGHLDLPTRPLADAVRSSSAMRSLMKHFATETGAKDFERLRLLRDPVSVIREVGKLESQLVAADRASASVARPITGTSLPAKAPAGGSRTRAGTGTTRSGEMPPFDAWMLDEDAKALQKKREALGLTVPA